MEAPFHVRSKRLVKGILNSRNHLIKTNKGHNDQRMRSIAETLSNLIEYWKYGQDETMAKFIYKHATEIQYIIPGADSGCHDKMTRQLNELLSEALTILEDVHEPIR